jgi:hypothetical protein
MWVDVDDLIVMPGTDSHSQSGGVGGEGVARGEGHYQEGAFT